MKIALIGCGFVADYYLKTLQLHKNIEIAGVYDRDQVRADNLSKIYQIPTFKSLGALLSKPEIKLVVNLTNPKSHYEISKACLEAEKHVYSEKPLAMDFQQACELVELSKRKGIILASAPCSVLGESAQTLWKAIRDNIAGPIKLVYAELDDGPIHKMHPENWKSSSGTPWPAKDEYETGCTLEHAGYFLTWLTAIFGTALKVTSFSACLEKDKGWPEPLSPSDTPDFSVACITFSSGVVARLTCSIIAPHDHSIRVIGDKGILTVDECWHFGSPVKFLPYSKLAFKADRYAWIRNNPILKYGMGLSPKKLPFVKEPNRKQKYKRDYMDYSRGVVEVIDSLKENRPCRLNADFALHVNELTLAIQNAFKTNGSYIMTTTSPPMSPMA